MATPFAHSPLVHRATAFTAVEKDKPAVWRPPRIPSPVPTAEEQLSPYVYVPRVIGFELPIAKAVLEANGVTVIVAALGGIQGPVTHQSPAPGSRVQRGTSVWVS